MCTAVRERIRCFLVCILLNVDVVSMITKITVVLRLIL
jgi:hypothetical protein